MEWDEMEGIAEVLEVQASELVYGGNVDELPAGIGRDLILAAACLSRAADELRRGVEHWRRARIQAAGSGTGGTA